MKISKSLSKKTTIKGLGVTVVMRKKERKKSLISKKEKKSYRPRLRVRSNSVSKKKS